MPTEELPVNSDGTLSAYAWPGGYPIYYLDQENSALCHACANEHIDNEHVPYRPSRCGIHWEGEPIICDKCNSEIASAYGRVE